MCAAEQISEITPRSYGYDRKHPVVMYYFAAGVLCGNIFSECSYNTLPTVNRLPNGVRALFYKINPVRLASLLYLASGWLSSLSLFLIWIYSVLMWNSSASIIKTSFRFGDETDVSSYSPEDFFLRVSCVDTCFLLHCTVLLPVIFVFTLIRHTWSLQKCKNQRSMLVPHR